MRCQDAVKYGFRDRQDLRRGVQLHSSCHLQSTISRVMFFTPNCTSQSFKLSFQVPQLGVFGPPSPTNRAGVCPNVDETSKKNENHPPVELLVQHHSCMHQIAVGCVSGLKKLRVEIMGGPEGGYSLWMVGTLGCRHFCFHPPVGKIKVSSKPHLGRTLNRSTTSWGEFCISHEKRSCVTPADTCVRTSGR